MKKLFARIRLWFKKRELRKAVEAANKTEALTGRKVLIVNVAGELRAMYKTDFKTLYSNTPSLKKRSIQQWEAQSDNWKKCYEDLKPENKFINSN